MSLVAQMSCESGSAKAIVVQDGAGIYVEAHTNDQGAKSV